MTRNENLLVATVEECAEITKDLTKLLRFGDETIYCDSNATAALTEFYQLEAMIELCQEAGILPTFSEADVLLLKSEKCNKFDHFVKKSIQTGHVSE